MTTNRRTDVLFGVLLLLILVVASSRLVVDRHRQHQARIAELQALQDTVANHRRTANALKVEVSRLEQADVQWQNHHHRDLQALIGRLQDVIAASIDVIVSNARTALPTDTPHKIP